MDNRTLEIIFQIVEYMQANQGRLPSLETSMTELKQLGFEEDEIKQAHTWLADRHAGAPDRLYEGIPRIHAPHRILTPEERLQVSPEAYGLLLTLLNLGVIDPEQFESSLEKAFVYGIRPVNVDQIKWITSGVVAGEFSADEPDELPQTYLDPPGRVN